MKKSISDLEREKSDLAEQMLELVQDDSYLRHYNISESRFYGCITLTVKIELINIIADWHENWNSCSCNVI